MQIFNSYLILYSILRYFSFIPAKNFNLKQRERISDCLSHTIWNISFAKKRLSISESTRYRALACNIPQSITSSGHLCNVQRVAISDHPPHWVSTANVLCISNRIVRYNDHFSWAKLNLHTLGNVIDTCSPCRHWRSLCSCTIRVTPYTRLCEWRIRPIGSDQRSHGTNIALSFDSYEDCRF